MARHLRLGEFLLGVEGIALMRHLFEDDALAATRLEEIRRIACGDERVYQLGVDVPIVDVASGYARWSQTYDNAGNPLIQVEQPVAGRPHLGAASRLILHGQAPGRHRLVLADRRRPVLKVTVALRDQ